MTETNNLKLSLPGSSDYVDVNVLNENFKKIDAKAVHASSHSTGGNDPISPESIGAASSSHSHAQSDIEGLEEALSNVSASSHKHSTSDITSGTLSTARLPTVPITKGGTGATDAANARKNLGAAASDHTHTPESIGAAPNVPAQVIIYVAKSGSDDTGDGTQEKPYLTIQKAVDSAPRVHCDLRIYIGPGTYDESVFVYALSNISIRAQDLANKPIVKSFRLAQCANGTLMNIVVNGVYDETYRAAVYVEHVAKMYMEGVVCTANDKSQSAYGGGIRFNGGIGRLTNCEISNKYTALSAVGSVVFLDKGCTGTNNTNSLVAGDGYGNIPAAIFKGTSTISGAEVTGFGGKIW